uniref:Uncharacterized protein n=1 Tax=Anguilla anguilla TaxID=7936 RepID=A0A0E9UNK6_ANGAN
MFRETVRGSTKYGQIYGCEKNRYKCFQHCFQHRTVLNTLFTLRTKSYFFKSFGSQITSNCTVVAVFPS